MKIFFAILGAILVAAILGGLYGELRVDEWEKTTAARYAQVFRVRSEYKCSTNWNAIRDRETQAYRLLAQSLEHKPFSIPLDQEEQSDLDGIRVELARGDQD